MAAMHERLRPIALSLLASAAGAAPACEATSFADAQVHHRDALPVLAWQPVPGAVAYLVEIVARVPEGPVVERRTLRTTQTVADLPRLDTSRATKITLTVAVDCGAARSPPATRMVVVAPGLACPPVAALAAGTAASARAVSWQAVAGVDYELRAFDAATGAMVLSRQGPAAAAVAIPGRAPTVVAVRPRCGAAIGPMSYLFVD